MNDEQKEYMTFSEADLYLMMQRTGEINRDPYKLFVAFILSNISDCIEEEEENKISPFLRMPIWGQRVPEDIYNIMYKNCLEDFKEAIANKTTIDIYGKPYMVRKADGIDMEKLADSFQFPVFDGYVSICKNGVKNVNVEVGKFNAVKQRLKDDLDYIRKIIYFAEANDDGWDSLTDMEVVAYLWALYISKAIRKNIKINDKWMVDWYKKRVCEYVSVPLREIQSAWSDRIKIVEHADTVCVFSSVKIRDWNRRKHQKSCVDGVSSEDAENYWYETATKKFI